MQERPRAHAPARDQRPEVLAVELGHQLGALAGDASGRRRGSPAAAARCARSSRSSSDASSRSRWPRTTPPAPASARPSAARCRRAIVLAAAEAARACRRAVRWYGSRLTRRTDGVAAARPGHGAQVRLVVVDARDHRDRAARSGPRRAATAARLARIGASGTPVSARCRSAIEHLDVPQEQVGRARPPRATTARRGEAAGVDRGVQARRAGTPRGRRGGTRAARAARRPRT